LYYEATNEGGQLLCVSPGNQLPTHFNTDASGGKITTQPTPEACPASFQPVKENGFLKRLTFSFAIGQAF
jgi:hypothetical protein